MNWYLIGVAVFCLFLARRQAVEVRDGIRGGRREGVLTEDAFLGGFYFGIGMTLIAGAIMLWGGLLCFGG